jgi:DNA-binding transcriptional LysR family regulator
MELRQLEHFVAVAEEGHFTRAARRCHIVQSGLSASIRALERELGADLFARSTRHVELTEAGRALLPEGRRALAAAAAATDAVAAVEGLVRGTLSVGIMQSLGAIGLPAVLGRFRSEHPDVEIHLRQAASETLAAEVREGRLELAFAAIPDEPGNGLARRALLTEKMVAACAAGHPLAAAGSTGLKRLSREPFVDFEVGWGTRTAVDRAFADGGIERRSGCVVNDVQTLIDLVANGLGVAVLPPSVVAASGKTGLSLVPIRGRAPSWTISLLTTEGAGLSAAARALVSLVPDPGLALPTWR